MLRNCLIIVAAWLALGTVMAADDPGQVLVANTAADGPAALAKPAVESTEEERIKQDEEKRRFFSYSRKGLQISEEGKGRFSAKVNIRSQIRFSSPFQSAPRDEGDFSAIEEGDLRFRRARFKMEGHAFTPWVKYKYEHDLVGTRVLDARMTIGKWEWLQFRFGQWKVGGRVLVPGHKNLGVHGIKYAGPIVHQVPVFRILPVNPIGLRFVAP